MEPWKRVLGIFFSFLFLLGIGFLIYRYYSYLFARIIDGRVVGISKVAGEDESYVVALKLANGDILTAKSEDPRWALVHVGQCAKSKFFPHPPWDLEKNGMYFKAALLQMKECELPQDTKDTTKETTNEISSEKGGNNE